MRAQAKAWNTGLGIVAACSAAMLVGCSREGDRPQTVLIQDEEIAVHRLVSLTDPYSDLFISPERGVFVDFGRTEPIISCERRGYVCTEWPFVFSFPVEGDAPTGSWTVGQYEFEVIGEVRRDFCGRSRDVYLVEGSNSVGWSTRVWYHPSFGVYAVMSGQAEDGVMTQIERAFTTCDRGLYARGRGLAFLEEDEPRRTTRR